MFSSSLRLANLVKPAGIRLTYAFGPAIGPATINFGKINVCGINFKAKETIDRNVYQLANDNIGIQGFIYSKMRKISTLEAIVGSLKILPAPKISAAELYQFFSPKFVPCISVSRASLLLLNGTTSQWHVTQADVPRPTAADSTEESAQEIEFQVKDVFEELVQALELFEEEKQQTAEPVQVVSTPVTLKSCTTRTVRWNDQIETVKHYEVTLEERRYKRSLKNFMKSKGPAPWVNPLHCVPSCHSQRANVQVMLS
jgi:hypothetical protein